ncbi:hypothetical protein Rsw2DRAFT_0020 [Rhodobacter ferrooxidans]|uniref:Uncharacterized protein n=1 Tax=Rhodobacter ferrooxidans TaxID=371731 RepID=C8RW42_9RHOB|nr:hypothetical protein Rsw2DRAFT_0020 [Rhodobacter sp. SW2]
MVRDPAHNLSKTRKQVAALIVIQPSQNIFQTVTMAQRTNSIQDVAV